jgi:hypothetical protein
MTVPFRARSFETRWPDAGAADDTTEVEVKGVARAVVAQERVGQVH